jgi:serine/threonine protein kinase
MGQVVRQVFRQILDAVGTAHRMGIIHRDLKPSNILLEERGSELFPRVIDFGIAKIEGERNTRTGAQMGTPHFMSPEQIKGAGDVTARSDIFSLGATLYEFSTGKRVFDAPSEFGVMQKIVKGEFLPPAQVYPQIEPDISAAIHRALECDPTRRFGSCGEFAGALLETVKLIPGPEVKAEILQVSELPVPKNDVVVPRLPVSQTIVSQALLKVEPKPLEPIQQKDKMQGSAQQSAARYRNPQGAVLPMLARVSLPTAAGAKAVVRSTPVEKPSRVQPYGGQVSREEECASCGVKLPTNVMGVHKKECSKATYAPASTTQASSKLATPNVDARVRMRVQPRLVPREERNLLQKVLPEKPTSKGKTPTAQTALCPYCSNLFLTEELKEHIRTKCPRR